MIFSEFKKLVSPDQHVSISTVMDDGKTIEHGLTIDHNKAIGDKELFPDYAWFNTLEVRWIGVYHDILLIELLEKEGES